MEKRAVKQTIKRILLALVICALAAYAALAVMGEISKHKSAEELLADSLSLDSGAEEIYSLELAASRDLYIFSRGGDSSYIIAELGARSYLGVRWLPEHNAVCTYFEVAQDGRVLDCVREYSSAEPQLAVWDYETEPQFLAERNIAVSDHGTAGLQKLTVAFADADSLPQNTVFEYPQADGTVLYAAADY